jgi:topoisomerase-4 subunit B
MYTRTGDPTHIIHEVIDNAADEALAGAATRIDVRVYADQSVSVEDDGRGIPVGIHPEEKVSTVEVVFTRLHAGGKFDKKDGEGAYAFSGGLHGVGVSVTNALSKRLEVEVKRDGKVHRIVFENGDVAEKLKVIGTCGQRASGTFVRAYPDPKYFDSATISLPDLERTLRAKAVLLPGVKITLHAEKGKEWKVQSWTYSGGLEEYLGELGEGMSPVAPVFAGEKYLGSRKTAIRLPRARELPGRSPGMTRARQSRKATSTSFRHPRAALTRPACGPRYSTPYEHSSTITTCCRAALACRRRMWQRGSTSCSQRAFSIRNSRGR